MGKPYTAPTLKVVGPLGQITLQGKTPGSPSDFSFPNNLSFVFT